jgi:hypothetical protein
MVGTASGDEPMRTSRTMPGLLLVALVCLGAGCADGSDSPGAAEVQLAPDPTPGAAEVQVVPDPSPGAGAASSPAPVLPSATLRPSRDPSTPSEFVTVPDVVAAPTPEGPVVGGDASWPQCPEGMGIPAKPTLGLPMPLASARFVILGLTNGPAFTPNPCLGDQVRWVAERQLMAAAYAVSSYPDDRTLARFGGGGPFDGGTRLGALRNVGYQQAAFNLATLRRAGLVTPIVWMDVEPVPVFSWSADTEANAAVVEGAARGYADAGYAVGVYSTQALWRTVVGDLELGLPEWRAAGQTSRAEALRRCGAERMFQGGRAVLAQWVEGRRDHDITCPGTAAELARWFHQY